MRAFYRPGCARCLRLQRAGSDLWDACEAMPPDCATCSGICHVEACLRPPKTTETEDAA